jgi:hypothetical protein
MDECQCNICKIVKCLRCPNNAEPIYSDGTPITRPIFSDECLCNTCIVVECLRHPKKAEPILKEEPVQPEPVQPEKIVEKVIIIREPCPPRRINPCPEKTIPWIDPSRITAYASGHPSRTMLYGVPPSRTIDPYRAIAYGTQMDSGYYTSTSTTVTNKINGSNNLILPIKDITDTGKIGSSDKKKKREHISIE